MLVLVLEIELKNSIILEISKFWERILVLALVTIIFIAIIGAYLCAGAAGIFGIPRIL